MADGKKTPARPPRGAVQRATEATSEQVLSALGAAVIASDAEVDRLLAAAADFVVRARSVTTTLHAAIERADLEQASRVAAALAALTRLAESRLLVAAERRRAALQVVDATVDALPGGRGPSVRHRAEVASARRVRKRGG